MTFDLGAQAENEAAVRVRLQVPADVGEHHGAAGEHNGHAGAEGNALRLARGHHQGKERVMTGLGAPHAVEPRLFGAPRGLRRGGERRGEEGGIDFHCFSFQESD